MEDKLIFEDSDAARRLFGALDSNLGRIEKLCGVKVNSRGGELLISGEPDGVAAAKELASQLYGLALEKRGLSPADFEAGAEIVSAGKGNLKDVLLSGRSIEVKGGKITPKTVCQREYIAAMDANTIVFGIGPAGTGKTFLAVAMAMEQLAGGAVRKIIITRPMLEAGENLGFLPGDLEQKADPFLRPFFDAVYDIAGTDTARRLIERKTIEIVPLAYMRGRTLSGAFVILDEAQNTSPSQMKMFLTRIGFNSKAVITGDATQNDLPGGAVSGLEEAERLLAGMEGIAVVRFSRKDVVRHPLVKKIVEAYEKRDR